MLVVSVESSTLATVGYDQASGLLELAFQSGAIYQYCGVPGAVHEELLEAPSKGRYFNRWIRGQYPYAQVSEEQQDRRPSSLGQDRDGRRLSWQGR